MLRCLLLLAAALCVASAASDTDSQAQHVLVSTEVALSAGRVAVWKPLTGANIGVTVTSSRNGSAADIMLMPLDQWELWQVSRADPAALHRVPPGGHASFEQQGPCRQEWALVVAHAWDADAYPRPKPVTAQVQVTGRLCSCTPASSLVTSFARLSSVAGTLTSRLVTSWLLLHVSSAGDDADCSKVQCVVPLRSTPARVQPLVVSPLLTLHDMKCITCCSTRHCQRAERQAQVASVVLPAR